MKYLAIALLGLLLCATAWADEPCRDFEQAVSQAAGTAQVGRFTAAQLDAIISTAHRATTDAGAYFYAGGGHIIVVITGFEGCVNGVAQFRAEAFWQIFNARRDGAET